MTRLIYKQWYFKFIIVFAVILFIGFIATSFGNVDRWFSDLMGEWVKVEFIKFAVIFYDEMGYTCLFLIMMISILIIFETWNLNNKGKPKAKILGYSCYTIVIATFLIYNAIRLFGLININTGWGQGFDGQFITTFTYRTVSRVVILFIDIAILTAMILFLRLKVCRTNVLIEKRVWMIAVSAIIFIIGSYFLLTLIFKQSFGRPFYLNVEFERYFGQITFDENGVAVDINLSDEARKLLTKIPNLKELILNTYNNSNHWTQAERYFKWFEVNGNWFQNLKFWYGGQIFEWLFNLDPNYVQPAGWSNQDFPSGHTISGFTGIYYALFASVLIKDEKRKTIITNSLFIIWFISEFLMINLLVIARTHYVADTWFSFAFCTFFFIFSLRISNIWMTKKMFKWRMKKGVLNDFKIIENKVFIFFQKDNKIFIGKVTSKKIDRKLKKYLNHNQSQKILLQ